MAIQATEFPELETERLRMRRHRMEDFTDCAAMWADARVTRYIGGKPLSEEESWARLLRYLGHWSLMGFGYWAIEEKATGKFAGEAGFADFKRDIEPTIKGIPEIGWAFASAFQGKGYATEAVRAAVAWGDRRFPSPRTICLIHPANVRSVRVAEKCGFQEFQQITYKGSPTLVYARG